MTSQLDLSWDLLAELLLLVGDLNVEHVAPIDLVDALATVGLKLVRDRTGVASTEYLNAIKAYR